MVHSITFATTNQKDIEKLRSFGRRIGLNARINKAQKMKSSSPVKKGKKAGKPNGKKMAIYLEKIALGGATNEIKDPVAWQKELRKDRTLILK